MPFTAASSAIDLLVGQLVEPLELELAATDVLGERAQVADLRAREARAARSSSGSSARISCGRGRAAAEALGRARP